MIRFAGMKKNRATRDRLKNPLIYLICMCGMVSGSSSGQTGQKSLDLTELSLEELMKIKFTLASKKPEILADVAAAVYVLTHDDIRRSGVTTIPDALRLVPGIQVGRIDANKWAISSRGFMDLYANKLLVLIDGRSVYSPVFSGVLWDAQDVLFPDIERIEVVRGPGATLWGANAVNGIINIITKSSRETQGGMAQSGWGTEEMGYAGFRFGGKWGRNTFYRFYAKAFDRNRSVFDDGAAAGDGWRVSRGGFRMDGNLRPNQSMTLQGDLYQGRVGQTMTIPGWGIRGMAYNARISGGNVLGRWIRTLSSTSEMILQMYFDRVVRRDTILIGGSYNVTDADFQHRFRLAGNHSIIWGLGYRLTRDQADENALVRTVPSERSYDVISLFIQDEMFLFQDRCRIIFGSKFEHNDFTGFEYQPGLRMLWKPGKGHSLWGAVSKALRTPSRVESDIRVFMMLQGNPSIQSERLVAFETGYRYQTSEHFYLDWTAYTNRYDRLRTHEVNVFDNNKSGRTSGFEVSADWFPLNGLRIRGTYTHCRVKTELKNNSLDTRSNEESDENPRHQFTLHSSVELWRRIDLDLSGRYVHKLPAGSLNVPSYFELDARFGWKPTEALELSIVGRNLIKRRHPEFTTDWLFFAATQVQRSLTGSVTWMF
jgi:iron complex outermembrane receptor protein